MKTKCSFVMFPFDLIHVAKSNWRKANWLFKFAER